MELFRYSVVILTYLLTYLLASFLQKIARYELTITKICWVPRCSVSRQVADTIASHNQLNGDDDSDAAEGVRTRRSNSRRSSLGGWSEAMCDTFRATAAAPRRNQRSC